MNLPSGLNRGARPSAGQLTRAIQLAGLERDRFEGGVTLRARHDLDVRLERGGIVAAIPGVVRRGQRSWIGAAQRRRLGDERKGNKKREARVSWHGFHDSRPPSIRSMRSHCAARRGLWVAMIAVKPNSACIVQQEMQRIRGGLVQVAGRFIRQQQRRLHHQRARHRDPLLFAARHHAGPVVEPLAEPDAPQ